jgi:hypothetical protein
LILPLQYHTLKFANGENTMESTLVMYNDKNSKYPVLTDSENTIIKPKVEVSIEGTTNNDQLKGGPGDDKINGEDGNDTISGKEGNDKINGGNDDDLINGKLGNDTLKGGNGNDKLSGEVGDDLLEGGKGDDTLLGGEGDEGILGNEGNDVLNGGEGIDIMAGGTGNDTFICDLFDTIIDFNLDEGDKIIGQCSPFDQNEFETSSDNTPQEDFHSDSPSPPPPPPQQQLPVVNQEKPVGDFQALSTSPIPPNNVSPEEVKLQPEQPQHPKQQSPSRFSHDNIPPPDFFGGSFPPLSGPPSTERYLSGPSFK